MVVGYSIRNIEVRFDMERVLGTNAKLAELPPGEIIWKPGALFFQKNTDFVIVILEWMKLNFRIRTIV